MNSPSKSARTAKALGTPRKTRTKASAQRPVQHSSDAPVEGDARATPHNASAGRVTVRVYRQGLGDCILVRVKRPGHDDFKLMIDCGVVLGTPDAGKIMTRVMENLVSDTQEKVDVLAITHEHWDHLSGFAQASDAFAKLAVGAVWVAWTEDLKDDLAKQLRLELTRAAETLAACAQVLRAAGDAETPKLLEDIAMIPLGAAASSSTSTKAAFDKVKALGNVRLCRPSDAPFEIPDANARIYVLGPPHDPKLIRKPNAPASGLESLGVVPPGVLSVSRLVVPPGVLSVIDSRADRRSAPVSGGPESSSGLRAPVETRGLAQVGGLAAALGLRDSLAPFHPKVTIPLGQGGRAGRSPNEDDWQGDGGFIREHYFGGDDWRRIDADWLGAAPGLALALQSYTNNMSLVLALELGDHGKGDVLLFAADAQVGNWESWQTWNCKLDGLEVTGPDLLQRTIFYKVGQHGGRNATLKEHGLEQMVSLRAAIIPVDENEAQKALGPHAATRPRRGAGEEGTRNDLADRSGAGQLPKQRSDR
jgi:hypothetical protein